MAEIIGLKWWAWQGLNLRPLRCQHIAYRCFAQKSAVFRFLRPRTSGEQTGFLEQVYRRFTAPLSPSDGGLNG